jgi:ATP-dependent helicase HrpB
MCIDYCSLWMLVPLPVDDHLSRVRDVLATHRAVVVVAAPGAGKTTRVPPALVADGPVLVLQPRRVAARSIARRIAEERGWTVGREVGWHVRFDRRVSADTRLTIATEGVLTAMLHQDPLLSSVRTVVLDEFHERSIHADLGLALVKQAWMARDDLRVVVMSATIDPSRVSAFLGGCPVIDVPGRQFPLEISHHVGVTVADAARRAVADTRGAVLCFLPGAREIQDAARALQGVPWPVFPLHGGLEADEQDRALTPTDGPRIVLATNLAETTLTVPDVTAVVDTGLHKVARYDAGRAIDTLVTERVSLDSADQRAGRAGRTQAGVVYRLWDVRDRLRPHREPEIFRVDLAGPVLDVAAWGGDPGTFEWFEAPPAHAVAAAVDLLVRLGALDARGQVTQAGQEMRRLPLHPRLARLLLSAGRSPRAARVAACLSDGVRMRSALASETRESDVDVFGDESALPPHLRPVVRHLMGANAPERSDDELRRAVLDAYPDRVARRRGAGKDTFLLASGVGATLARESGVRHADFVVAVDVGSLANGDTLIRLASAVDAEWLRPTHSEVTHSLVEATGAVRATRTDRYGAVVLHERVVAPDPDEARRVLADAYLRREPSDRDARLKRRLQFAGLEVDLVALAAAALDGVSRLDEVHLEAHLPGRLRADLARLAPDVLRVPSGREHPIVYRDDGGLEVSVKLQEVFGLAETPRLGPQAVPVTFVLLAPNQRPVQVTRDLKSFWTRGYPEVRKELRGRYPKHPWPDDPWTATPTHRARRQVR